MVKDQLESIVKKPGVKILVTRMDRIGDVMLSTPVLTAIRKHYPYAKILVMTQLSTAALLRSHPAVDELIVYDKKKIGSSIKRTLTFANDLKAKQIDVCIHLHPTLRVHLLGWLAKIPVRIGYNSKAGFLNTISIHEKKSEGKRHEADYNFDLLRFINIFQRDGLLPSLQLTSEDHHAFENTAAALSFQPAHRYYAIHMGASCPSKRWPFDHFVAVAKELYFEYSLIPILVGDELVTNPARRLIEELNTHAHDLTGQLSLRELAVVLKQVRFLISNDSGPVHMATGLGTPVLSIFGRKNPGLSPQRWAPLGPEDHYLHDPPDCRPCLAHRCQINFECLHNIKPEHVLSMIKEHFQQVLPPR